MQLSLFGSEFIANLQEYLGVAGEPPVDIQFCPRSYLFVATSRQGAEILKENNSVQRYKNLRKIFSLIINFKIIFYANLCNLFCSEYDSKVELITKEGVKKRYPCMNVDNIVCASVGTANEGW